jgi:7-cyano-7-deazaguanine synthase
MAETRPKAVVLLSGGLDSATVLAIANATGYDSYALSFFYGQRHVWELECARRIAADLDVKDHRIAQIDLQMFGGSALTADISVPKGLARGDVGENSLNLCACT